MKSLNELALVIFTYLNIMALLKLIINNKYWFLPLILMIFHLYDLYKENK